MKKIILNLLFASYIVIGQNTFNSTKILDEAFNNLTMINGKMINFEYIFENPSHKMDEPIQGQLALFSNNRFFLKFNENENQIIQIYDGEKLLTILTIEKEIQIDHIAKNSTLFFQNIIKNYKTDFNIKNQITQHNNTTITLEPQIKYNEQSYNTCIDELSLPVCLKMPNQCKIGMSSKKKKLLDDCLKNNIELNNTGISKIEVYINNQNSNLTSIIQFDKYNGTTQLNIKDIENTNEQILHIDSTKYSGFEIIDLR